MIPIEQMIVVAIIAFIVAFCVAKEEDVVLDKHRVSEIPYNVAEGYVRVSNLNDPVINEKRLSRHHVVTLEVF